MWKLVCPEERKGMKERNGIEGRKRKKNKWEMRRKRSRERRKDGKKTG